MTSGSSQASTCLPSSAHDGSTGNKMCPMCESVGARADHPGDGTLYDTSKFCGGSCEGGEMGRIAALQALEMLDTPREEYFDKITELMQRIFDTPCSHLVLVDPGRCWFKSWQGFWNELEDEGVVQCPREMGWCNYITVSTAAEMLVIEDAQKDARVSLNPFVIGPPYFRFYAGAPLVGSRGERYGTLCVADFTPRAFTAEKYAMLVNFAALAVEELERNKRLHDQVAEVAGDIVEKCRNLDLSLQAVREGVLMLDIRESNWLILYTNPAFASASGLSVDDLLAGSFWDLFECRNKARLELGLATGIGDSFQIEIVCKATQNILTLRLLPASTDQLAPSKATGLPAWAPSEGAAAQQSNLTTSEGQQTKDIVDAAKCFWFAMVGIGDPDTPATSLGSTLADASDLTSCTSGSSYGDYLPPTELGRLQMGPLLGSGSFGKVYHATTGDKMPVAVKVIDCRKRIDNAMDAQVREVQLNCKLEHPNVVQVLAYATSTDQFDGQEIGALWMVQEFCNLGTLTLAAERGWMRQEREMTSPADLAVLVPTLLDVAKAMDYVHSHDVVHADLTGRNVLLASSELRPCGFIAKVCDFGLARYTYGKPFATKVLGTVTHMPPELLTKNLLVPEADIWAFGIIAWEAFHGKCCYRGKMPPQIVIAVVRNKPLEWPTDAPHSFVALIKRCLAYEYAERPPFPAIITGLEEICEAAGSNEHLQTPATSEGGVD